MRCRPAVTAAKAALANAEWRFSQKTVAAPVSGFVVDTLYRPGEMVQAGQAVVQLLPPEFSYCVASVPTVGASNPVVVRFQR